MVSGVETVVAGSKAVTGTTVVAGARAVAGKTVVAVYRGPYENTWMGSEAVMSYLKTHPKLSPAGPMWEAYISDPELEKDTANWQTNVIFPVN